MISDRLRRRRARIADLLAFLGYWALTLIFYAPLLVGLRSFPPGDFTDHFLPFSLFQRAELLAGRLPLWNPYTFSGHPFLADVQAAVFYPLSNLVLLLTLPWSDPAARLYWLQVEAIIHIALAGGFTYLLAHALTRNRLAAFLAGCTFAFSGYLTGYPPLQLAVLRTAIWLPLILWLLRRAVEHPELWRWWIAASAAYAVAFLAGHSQTFLFVSYAVAGWIGALLISAGRPRARYLGRVAAFYGLFLALSAAQLAPSVEFAGLSVRADVDYAFVSGGFPLHDTWQLLLPGVTSSFASLHVGLAPLGLAFVGAVAASVSMVRDGRPTSDVARRRMGDRLAALYFLAMALLALLVSYGNHGFLYPVFYRWAPGWALFRGQERAAYLVAFGLSMLAGYGAAALGGLSVRQRRALGVGYPAVAAVGLLVATAALWPSVAVGASEGVLWRGLAAGAFTLVAWGVVLWLDLSESRRLWLLIALTVAGLLAANSTGNLAPRRAYPPLAALALRENSLMSAGSAPGRVHNEDVLFEDYGMLVGIEEASGSSPLRLARYQALLSDFPRERLWRLAGVKWVLSSRPELHVPVESRAPVVAGDVSGTLHRLAADNPRAWVVHTLLTMDDAQALPLLGDKRFDPEQTAVIPPPASQGLEAGVLASAGQDRVRLERIAPNRLAAHVQSEHGGLLVVSENWMPGWRATVERAGPASPHDIPVVRADLTFLGVPVEPGESRVELTYAPDSVRFGLAVSGFALLLLGAAAVWRRVRGSERGAAETAVRAEGGACQLAGHRASAFSRPRLMMLLVLALALMLRVFLLGYQELRGDEALGRLFTLEPFAAIVASTITLREPHPVASYFVEKVWLDAAGHSEFALRFASLWFGVLAVALLYRLGRRLGLGWPASIIAAALLAISPYAIWHSQDARMYSMSLALTTASTLLMLEALARGRWFSWLGYVGVTWLALHTHYYAAYVVMAQNVFVLGRALWAPPERGRLPAWLAAQAATALLYLPWLLAARATLTGYGGNGDSPAFLAMWVRSLSVFAAGESTPGDQRPLLALLVVLLLACGGARLALAGPEARRTLWLLALYLVLPLLATWLGALARPIFNERYLVAAIPAFFLLSAAALFGPPEGPASGLGGTDPHERWRAGLRVVAAGALALLMAAIVLSLIRHYADPAYSKTRGWRVVAAVMERYSAAWPPDKVRAVQTFPDPTLWYYYRGPAEGLVLPPAADSEEGAAREVAALVAKGVQRVVIAAQENPIWDARGIAPASLLRGGYELLSETPVGDWQVQVYGLPPTSLPSIDVSFVSIPDLPGVRLTGALIPVESLLAGDVLPVHLHWSGDPAALSGAEKITLQLLDADGKLVAQTDQPLAAARFAEPVTGYRISLPRSLPSGVYRLIVALYDPSKPGAPRWRTASGADHAELAILPTADRTMLR